MPTHMGASLFSYSIEKTLLLFSPLLPLCFYGLHHDIYFHQLVDLAKIGFSINAERKEHFNNLASSYVSYLPSWFHYHEIFPEVRK